MKIISEAVEMVAKGGNPIPVRFKYGDHVIDVEQVIETSEEKLAGNRMKIFSRRSEIGGELKRFDHVKGVMYEAVMPRLHRWKPCK